MRELVIRGTRAVTYLLVLGGVTGMIGTRVVRAEATSAAMGIGEKMLGLELGPGARELVINGQRVRVSSAVTPLPLRDVLDRLTDACRKDADRLGTELSDLPHALAENRQDEAHAGIGILRDERDGRGVVSCFATGADETLLSVRERLGKLVKSHDLEDIGHLRYMAARTLPEGGTLVVSTWSEGPIALDALFPQHGDAAGDDPSAAPRPANARRLLSLHAAPSPYGVFVYECATPDAYDAALRAAGFKPYQGATSMYRRGNVDVLVSVDQGTLSVVEMSSRSVVAEGGVK